MKYLFLFAAIGILAIASAARAQQMMIGARFGLDLANQHYTNLPYEETISGRTLGLGGAQLDYDFNAMWAVSMQVLFDQKGAHADMLWAANGPAPPSSNSEADWTVNYLEIPFLAKVGLGDGVVRPYIFAGPSIGFLLSNIETVQGTEGTSIPNGIGVIRPVDTTANISAFTAPIDISLVAGVGISVSLASGMELLFDATDAYGLTNSDNYSWDNNAYGIYVYSRDIRLAAGILFPLN